MIATMKTSTLRKVKQPLKQKPIWSRRYSSQLEFYYLLFHAKTVDKLVTLLRGKSEEGGVQHGTIIVKSVVEEDIKEVFANPSIIHQKILIYNLES